MTKQYKDTGTGSAEPDEVSVHDILAVVDQIIELDERRQEALQKEIEQTSGDFVETRDILEKQKEQLQLLDSYLSAETEHLSDLIERTDHLTVEQAVRNRDQAIEKIENHNETLSRFQTEMEALIATVEKNLRQLRSEGTDAELEDSHEHLEAAIAAIQDHNDTVEELDKNLRILGAYIT